MQLPHNGFDNQATYYELNNHSAGIPTIFIHGVGLDNTMWYPQKYFFDNESIIFYDILNHGNSRGGYKELNFSL